MNENVLSLQYKNALYSHFQTRLPDVVRRTYDISEAKAQFEKCQLTYQLMRSFLYRVNAVQSHLFPFVGFHINDFQLNLYYRYPYFE